MQQPSEVWDSVKVGFGFVLQQTPFALTLEPPLSVIFPPLMAKFSAILLTDVVVRVGNVTVVKDC